MYVGPKYSKQPGKIQRKCVRLWKASPRNSLSCQALNVNPLVEHDSVKFALHEIRQNSP